MTEISGDVIEALLENANRLGLKWNLTPATVVSTLAYSSRVLVVVDGDTEPIAVDSLVGILDAGVRVMVVSVPPAGNYIIGYYSQTVARRALTQVITLFVPSDQILSTSFATASNLTTTFTLDTAAVIEFSSNLDIYQRLAGSGTVTMQLSINSVLAQMSVFTNFNGARQSMGNVYAASFTPGVYVIQVLAKSDAGAVHQIVGGQISSSMTVKVFQ